MTYLYRWMLIALVAGTPLAANAVQQGFTVRDTEVFAGPSDEFPPVGVLGANSGVNIVGCLRDWSWCDVIFSRYRGWVYAADLAVPYHNDRVVVIERGPQIGPALGLVVLAFSLNTYWDRHYRSEPWYREREQWARRVRVEGDHGVPPPRGRAAQQTQRSQPRRSEDAPQAVPREERAKGVPESARTAPGAGGKHPKEEHKRDEVTQRPQRRAAPDAGPSHERPKGVPESGRAAPGAGGNPPEHGSRSRGQQKDHGARGGDKSQGGKKGDGKKDDDR